MQVLGLNNAGTQPIAAARLTSHGKPMNPGHSMPFVGEIVGNTRHARSKCMTALPFQHHGTGSIDLNAPRRGSKSPAGRRGAGEKTQVESSGHLFDLQGAAKMEFPNFGVSRD